MPILAGDIKLLATQVMADVADGGGAPTGSAITDGASNSIFPDISESDRSIGRVNLRKIAVAVHTLDTDTYLGANVIVAEPPSDPRVSTTIFSTKSVFDRRNDAKSRVESYLAPASEWGGFLLENHIVGQRAVQLFQRKGAPTPPIGRTLVLRQDEGLASQREQYVRVTRVTTEVRTFSFESGGSMQDYEAAVVTCEISDALRYDFGGTAPNRAFARNAAAAKVRDTLVADAARYYGVVPLSQAAHIGDLSARVTSIYTNLVPSAQSETPMTDIAPAGNVIALQPAGDGTITITTSAPLSPASSIFVGGGVMPGSLSVAGAVTLSDANGKLYAGATEVGQIDYANGVLSISAGGSNYGGAKTITFKPAASPVTATESASIRVTVETRSLSITATLDPIPAPATLTVSYMAQGQWYVLREQGSGAITGADPAFGAGTLSFTTGSLNVTFGALPDVGSQVILSWGTRSFAGPVPASAADRAGFRFSLGRAVAPGTLAVHWSSASIARTATDVAGALAGDATGTVNYTTGEVFLMPSGPLPAPGAEWSATSGSTTESAVSSLALVDMGGLWEASTGGAVQPNSFSAQIPVDTNIAFSGAYYFPPWSGTRQIRDDGAGVIDVVYEGDAGTTLTAIGTINYATGLIRIDKTVAAMPHDFPYGWSKNIQHFYLYPWKPSAGVPIIVAANFTGPLSVVQFVGAGSGAALPDVTGQFDQAIVRIRRRSGARLVSGSVRFSLGGVQYLDRLGRVVSGLDPATGSAVDVGPADYVAGEMKLGAWSPETSGAVVLESALVQWSDAIVSSLVFRTPVAPVRPGSLSVAATQTSDGAVVTGTFGTDGFVVTPAMVGVADTETGVARVWFRKATGTAGSAEELDLTTWGIPGITTIFANGVYAETIRFNAVGYSYIPLDADLIGIDPVRLPSDGRVPIFRAGDQVVFGHTASHTQNVSNGQTIDVARVRLSRVRVVGSDGQVIPSGYTADLNAGHVTFTDVSGYAQPVTIEDRIEDMVLVSDAQITGMLAFTRPLTHDFPLGSHVSSALMAGDMFAHTETLFDQTTWTGVWSDALIGSGATGTYNDILYPIAVSNAGATTERWAVRFTNTTTFDVMGEHVGLIASGNTTTDCAPLNPVTGAPYFTLRAAGWGGGWATGNVLRFNTVGAVFPVWVVRTIQQGTETTPDDSFTLLARGDVNKP